MAKGNSLAEILDSLCRLVEAQPGEVLASILLVDGNHLRHGGAPSLPKAYTDAINGTVIGPSAGSCGTAAYRGEPVIVEDIATDPLWADYRYLALPHSLCACWSTPVFSSQGEVIATFAMYYREPRRPTQRDQEVIDQITHLAGAAIQQKLAEEKLQRSEAYLAQAQKLTHTGSWAWDPRTEKVLSCSEEMFRVFGLDPRESLPSRDNFRQRIHPEDRDRIATSFERLLRGRVDSFDEYRIVMPDRTVRHINSSGHPILDESGELIEIVSIAVDVTERKRAELERRRLAYSYAKRLIGSMRRECIGHVVAFGERHLHRVVIGRGRADITRRRNSRTQSAVHFWAVSVINMLGFDMRQAQGVSALQVILTLELQLGVRATGRASCSLSRSPYFPTQRSA